MDVIGFGKNGRYCATSYYHAQLYLAHDGNNKLAILLIIMSLTEKRRREIVGIFNKYIKVEIVEIEKRLEDAKSDPWKLIKRARSAFLVGQMKRMSEEDQKLMLLNAEKKARGDLEQRKKAEKFGFDLEKITEDDNKTYEIVRKAAFDSASWKNHNPRCVTYGTWQWWDGNTLEEMKECELKRQNVLYLKVPSIVTAIAVAKSVGLDAYEDNYHCFIFWTPKCKTIPSTWRTVAIVNPDGVEDFR